MDLRPDDLPEHLAGDVEEMLAEDPRVNEQGLRVWVDVSTVVVAGAVTSNERRQAIAAVVREKLPGYGVDNRVEVVPLDEPTEPEVF